MRAFAVLVLLFAACDFQPAKGDKLAMMEAMKMQTTIYAPVDGVVDQIHAAVGEAVESKDLIMRLRAT